MDEVVGGPKFLELQTQLGYGKILAIRKRRAKRRNPFYGLAAGLPAQCYPVWLVH